MKTKHHEFHDKVRMLGKMKMKRSPCYSFLMIALMTMIIMLSGCGSDDVVNDEGLTSEKADNQIIQEAQDLQDGKESVLYDSSEFLAIIPEWSGYAFCYVNDNAPDFTPDEIWTATQESLDPLDDLGRCGTANSCIGTDGMPNDERGDISEVHPTGWHTDKYDFVDGEMLYNRCHLIAHQLSGDDAVPRNLITGTSYMNRDGMLSFEVAIGNYVRDTANHVMYRVTPIFVKDEMLARGVHMEAASVEDGGTGLSFNVFCYNVQPGVDIDYRTGDNKMSEDTTALEDYQSGKFAIIANTLGVIPSEAEDVAQEQNDAQQDDTEEQKNQDSNMMLYVLNTNTGKFHYPDCKSVKDIKEKNRQDVEATREEIINRGFSPCGNCKP